MNGTRSTDGQNHLQYKRIGCCLSMMEDEGRDGHLVSGEIGDMRLVVVVGDGRVCWGECWIAGSVVSDQWPGIGTVVV